MLCQFLLCNKVNQLYVYIYPHIPSLLRLLPTLPIPPLQVVTKHRTDLPVLCGCFPLTILHLVVYICHCYSVTSSQLTLPSPHVLKSILCVCVFTPLLLLGSSEPFFFFFRFHIYVLAYGICLSLSDFTLYNSLQVHL